MVGVEVVAIAPLFLSPSIATTNDYTAIVENLMSFGEIDLAIITDDQDVSEIVDLKRLQIPAKIFNVMDIMSNFEPIPCPTKIALNDVHMHRLFYNRPLFQRHHTFVLYVKNPPEVLALFDRTVLNCTHIFEPGIYNMENRFLFIVDSDQRVAPYSEEIFNGSPYIANQR